MKKGFKTKWENHLKRAAARVLVAALTVTTCMQAMVFPAHAESYGKNGIVRDNMTSWQIVDDMGLGYNIGNTFDSIGSWITIDDPWEYQRAWNNDPVSKHFIQKVHQAGFKTIRLPVSWAKWIDGNNQIDPGYMAAVQTVVDWCMEEDMYVILNIHHDSGAADNSWVRNIVTDFDGTSRKYAAVWTQIANNFANYGDHLIFEGMNEVEFPAAGNRSREYELLNHLNQLFVDTVRGTGGNNAKRHLLIPGFNTDIKMTSDRRYHMPEDPAGRCILSIHYYSPSPFAVAEHNVDWCEPVTTWGSEEDIAAVREHLDILVNSFLGKGVPVIIGEYGVLTEDNKEKASIHAYVQKIPEIMMEYGMCPVLWDTSNAGDMKFIERNTGEFYDPQIRANYAELARRKASGQIEKRDLTIPNYKEVQLPISPGGWVSLESFEPSKVLGVKFRLVSASGWDSYGGGGIWIDGYDNTPQYQFNSVYDEVTYMFTEEERARLGDRLGILLWWTDESKGGSMVKDLSFENGRVTILYADGENVSEAGPYTNTGSHAGGGSGGGGGGSSSRPNNGTTPGGSGNQYGDKENKDFPYKTEIDGDGNERADVTIAEICPDYEPGDTIRLTFYPMTDDWAAGAVCEYNQWETLAEVGDKAAEFTITPNTEKLTLRIWNKGGTYYLFNLKGEVVKKAERIPEIILSQDNTSEAPEQKSFSLNEMKEMLSMPDLKEGQRYQVSVDAESEDGNPYKCEVAMTDKNGVELKFELEGGQEERGIQAQALSSYAANGSLIGTPNSDSVIRIKVIEGRVRVKNIAIKVLEEFEGLSEMQSIGQMMINSGQIEKKTADAGQEDGLRIYYNEDVNIKEDLGGHLLINSAEGWDDNLTADKWQLSQDEDGKYIYIPSDAFKGVNVNLVYIRLWTVGKPFQVMKVVQLQKEKEDDSFEPFTLNSGEAKEITLEELMEKLGITSGSKVRIKVTIAMTDADKDAKAEVWLKDSAGGEKIYTVKSGNASWSSPDPILTAIVDSTDRLRLEAIQDENNTGSIEVLNIEMEPVNDQAIAGVYSMGKATVPKSAIDQAVRNPELGEKAGVKVYYSSNGFDMDAASEYQVQLTVNGTAYDSTSWNKMEDGEGTYIWIETDSLTGMDLAVNWNLDEGASVEIIKIVSVEKDPDIPDVPDISEGDYEVPVTPDADGKYQVPENGDLVLTGVRFKAKIANSSMDLIKYRKEGETWDSSVWLNSSDGSGTTMVLDSGFASAQYFEFDSSQVTDISDFELLYWEEYEGTVSADDPLAAELPRDKAPVYMSYQLENTADYDYGLGVSLIGIYGSDASDTETIDYWVGAGSSIGLSYDFEGKGNKDKTLGIITKAIANNAMPRIKFAVDTDTYPDASITQIKFYYNEASDPVEVSGQALSYNTMDAVQKAPGMFYLPVNNIPVGIRYSASEPTEDGDDSHGQATLRMWVPHEQEESKEEETGKADTLTSARKASRAAGMAAAQDLPLATASDALPYEDAAIATASNAALATASNAAPDNPASLWKAIADRLKVSPDSEGYYEFTPAERNAIGSFIRWAEDHDSEEPPILYFDLDELGYWVEKLTLIFESDEILDMGGFGDEEYLE